MKIVKHTFTARIGGFAQKFPWATLCDGKTRLLEPSDLNGIEPDKFRSSLRKAAAKLGFKLNWEAETNDDGEPTGNVYVGTVAMTDAEKVDFATKTAERKAAKKAKKAAKKAAENGDGDGDEVE